MNMKERRNYYRILGVQPDAPTDVIYGVYQIVMQNLQRRSDRQCDARDAATFNAAWHVLGDPVRRTEYDRKLLRKYCIRLLSSGGTPPPSAACDAAGNRRNYYRVLGLQRDVSQSAINAAYRTMSNADPANGLLIGEAYSVLSDPDQRRQYDISIATAGHAGYNRHAVYAPLITSYCAFCKTPNSKYPGPAGTEKCGVCKSPTRETAITSERNSRGFASLDLETAIKLYEYWPGPSRPAKLEEITPEKLRLFVSRPLEDGQVVRVTSAVFDAVAKVVHCDAHDEGFCSGMELMAVAFAA